MNEINDIKLIWGSILLAPLLAISIYILINKYRNDLVKPIIISSILVLTTTIFCTSLKIGFSNQLFNTICLISTYFSYCLIAASCWQIKHKIIKLLAIIIAIIPITIGYLLGTVGCLGLMFIVGDMVRPPFQKQLLEPGLECQINMWGMAASDSGYTVSLYKSWPSLPFLHREVQSITINETKTSRQATCIDVLEQYKKLRD